MKMFTATEIDNLSYLLSKVTDEEAILSPEELHGLLFGLAITPEHIPAEEWITLVLGKDPEFDDDEDAKTCMDHLYAVYQRILHDGNTGKLRFPFNYKKLTEFEFSMISGWAYGLFLILSLRPQIWGIIDKYKNMQEDEIPEKLRDVISACIIITALAFPEQTAQILDETTLNGKETHEEIEDELYLMLPAGVEALQKYGRSLMKEMHPDGIHPDVYQEPRKIGRNEPCPCGSGKKYKKCCGAN